MRDEGVVRVLTVAVHWIIMFVHVRAWIPRRKTLGKKPVCFFTFLQKTSEFRIIVIATAAAVVISAIFCVAASTTFSQILVIAITSIIGIIVNIQHLSRQFSHEGVQPS